MFIKYETVIKEKKKIKKNIAMPRLKDDLTIKMDDDNMLARLAEPHAIHNDNTNVNLPFYYKFISIVFFFIFALKS